MSPAAPAAPAAPAVQVTHRETIRDMGELGAAVIVKGKYYKLGTAPGPNDERKLYLHIEGERGRCFCVGVAVLHSRFSGAADLEAEQALADAAMAALLEEEER